MFHELLEGATVWRLLLKIDEQLCEEAQSAGCHRCGGRLDAANYPRKPRGLPAGAEIVRGYDTRFSLCCDGCRKRVTPPSVRFLGRRVYVGAVVLLLAVMRIMRVRVGELTTRYGPSRRTLERWRSWWRWDFPQTRVWRAGRGLLARPADEGALPRSLLACFVGDAERQTIGALRFVSPLTTGSSPDL